MDRCGIILAGGKGTRLYPLTKVISKQLLPIYDKPLIYYPLSTLKKTSIKDILIIVSSTSNLIMFSSLLGDGSQYGLNLTYKVQDVPRGLADAFLVGEEFIKGRDVALALGDNIFYGETFDNSLLSLSNTYRNIIFGCYVKNPDDYGVAQFNNDNLIRIVEKPKEFISNYAVPGLYFYDNTVVDRAKQIQPSKRGELEITDLTNTYINDNNLKFIKLPKGTVWFDTGTHDHLLEASEFVRSVQSRTGIIIGDLYERKD